MDFKGMRGAGNDISEKEPHLKFYNSTEEIQNCPIGSHQCTSSQQAWGRVPKLRLPKIIMYLFTCCSPSQCNSVIVSKR
jgi:hypothetical protein